MKTRGWSAGDAAPQTDDDEKLVEQVAREIVDQHGADAVEILRERAEAADLLGDELAAETWRDIADAAERMLREAVVIRCSERPVGLYQTRRVERGRLSIVGPNSRTQ